ncbi:MAG TPA: hypothetical protein VF426_07650 [Marmoricola sp.]
MTEADQLASLIVAVEDERRLGPDQRPTQATDASLDSVYAYLKHAVELLRSGQTDNALTALQHAQYHVAESWSH